MEFLSWTIAVILGLSAIVSPIVTAIINNNYQLKMKNLEFYEKAKREALEDFVKNACALKYSSSIGCWESFNTSKQQLYIYFKDVPTSIDSLNSTSNDYFKTLTNIVQVLSKQIAKE